MNIAKFYYETEQMIFIVYNKGFIPHYLVFNKRDKSALAFRMNKFIDDIAFTQLKSPPFVTGTQREMIKIILIIFNSLILSKINW